ncbi:hypothetical protein EJ04DRAFT_528574 [Polyplosphaeria fusca]|uniref:Uncharacterized protein n=1 Tax=Polyplosphaeria fusca TaxID=682080 RepID=A0A9P4QJM1_9PLEO|nr:hypothetical protein EJ04DRAFT_528574 [Polyplosphaeria fusca]
MSGSPLSNHGPFQHALHDDVPPLEASPVPRQAISVRLREFLEELSDSHDDLVNARKDLLVEREKVRAAAKPLSAQRTQTRSAETAFMDLARQFCNEHGIAFPPHLAAAYGTLQMEHDNLGVLAEENFQAERSLDALEWEYLEKEEDFYQYDLRDHLADDTLGSFPPPESVSHSERPPPEPDPGFDPIPPGIADYRSALGESERLKRSFDGLRLKIVRFQSTEDAGDTSAGVDLASLHDDPIYKPNDDDLLTQISQNEVRVQHLRQDLMQYDDLIPVKYRRNSDNVLLTNRPGPSLDMASRARSDGDFPTLLSNTPSKYRIPDWLLDCLKKNALEKTHYQNILGEKLAQVHRPDYDAWEDCAPQFWFDDNFENPSNSEKDSLSGTGETDWVHLSPRTAEKEHIQPNTGLLLADPFTPQFPSTAANNDAGNNATSPLEPQGTEVPVPQVMLPGSPQDGLPTKGSTDQGIMSFEEQSAPGAQPVQSDHNPSIDITSPDQDPPLHRDELIHLSVPDPPRVDNSQTSVSSDRDTLFAGDALPLLHSSASLGVDGNNVESDGTIKTGPPVDTPGSCEPFKHCPPAMDSKTSNKAGRAVAASSLSESAVTPIVKSPIVPDNTTSQWRLQLPYSRATQSHQKVSSSASCPWAWGSNRSISPSRQYDIYKHARNSSSPAPLPDYQDLAHTLRGL